MDLFREIESVFKKLDHRLTDKEVACAAVKQLVRAHLRLRLSKADLVDFDGYLDDAFRRDSPFSQDRTFLLTDLKRRIEHLLGPAASRSPLPIVEWV